MPLSSAVDLDDKKASNGFVSDADVPFDAEYIKQPAMTAAALERPWIYRVNGIPLVDATTGEINGIYYNGQLFKVR